MAKAIYTLKMFLFREQLVLDSTRLAELRTVCIFIVRRYVKVWFGCTNTAEAPNQDLNFVKDMLTYPEPDVKQAVLTKFVNHLWYLSEEAIGFAFFDPKVALDVKKKMVEALELSENLQPSETVKRIVVKMKEVTQMYAANGLSDFVTPNTIKLFNRMKISQEFLKFDPLAWNARDDYPEGGKICSNISVVNDAAERGVKLITDYNKILTHDKNEEQFILQIVKEYREEYPSHTKSALMNKKNSI